MLTWQYADNGMSLQAYTTATHAQEFSAFHREMVAHVTHCFQQATLDSPEPV